VTKIKSAGWESSLWRVMTAEGYGNRLHRFVLKRLGRRDAEDALQEIHLKLLRIPYNEFVRNPEAYIFKVAGRVLIDMRRAATRFRDHICVDTDLSRLIDENPQESQPDEMVCSLITSQSLELFLDQLPSKQKTVFILCERDGCSYSEIAERMDVSERAVERYLLKARERLAKILSTHQDPEPESLAGEKEAL